MKLFKLIFLLIFRQVFERIEEDPNDFQPSLITLGPTVSITPFMTIDNFPIIDGSDSTEPLREILMCKALGFDYQWGIYPIDMVRKVIYPNYTCTYEEKTYLQFDCLKRSNTHQSYINLIDDQVELVIAARSISRDEKEYAEEK